MNFFDLGFFGFFLISLAIYYQVRDKYQKVVLLVSSSMFVGYISIFFLLYTCLFILVNYILGLQIRNLSNNKKAQRIVCNSGILINIGSLVFFKYLNFLLGSISQVFNSSIHISAVNIIVPIGISYYTLQGISYLLQVYRGHEPPEKNIIVFSNFILFYPKFLSGPIELSKTFIPQLKKYFTFNYPLLREGLILILWGAFKKIVIADRLSIIINGVYSDLESFSSLQLIITFIIQPLHLYCDFSGYTDMALGMGKAFGLDLTNNFKRPFFSTSVTMFWQRWHISLTYWCTEYIFKRLSFKLRNWGYWSSVFSVFITFFVIGIWHGPRWTFILVGILQGIAINYEYFTKGYRLSIGNIFPPKLIQYTSYLFTYLFFCLTLIFYNSATLSDVRYFISNLFSEIDITNFNFAIINFSDKLIAFFSLLVLFIVEFRQENGKDIFYDIMYWPNWLRRGFYYLLCVLIIYFGSSLNEFVYMKF